MHQSAGRRLILALLMAALAGCATVATEVTVFDQTRKLAPTEHVAILLEYPGAPHVNLALIEARGVPGGSEAELFEAARKRARDLGADAIVRVAVSSVYQPPVRVYDPVYANPFYPYYPGYGYPYGLFCYQPYGPPFYPYEGYRWVGGGDVQTLKAVAIKYTTESR